MDGPEASGALARAEVGQPPTKDTLRVRVVGARGEALEGATVDLADSLSRWHVCSEFAEETGSEGEAVLPFPAEGASESWHVVAGKDGWQSNSTPARASAERVIIALRPSNPVRFRVLDDLGAPVVGALCTASSASLPMTEERDSDLRGFPGPVSEQVARGVTDARGRTDLRGLADGSFNYRIEAPGFVPSKVPSVPRTIPGPVYEVVMEPLVGIVARVNDGRVTSFVIDEDARSLLQSARPPSQGEWMQQRMLWPSRFPGCIVLVGFMDAEHRARIRSAPFGVDAAAFVDGVGWCKGTVHFRMLHQIVEPERCSFQFVSGEQATSVTLRGPDGKVVDHGTIDVWGDSPLGDGSSARFAVDLGEKISLPLGQMVVAEGCLPATLMREDDRVFEVRRGSDAVELALRRPAQYAELDIKLPGGARPTCVLVTVSGVAWSGIVGAYGGHVRRWFAKGPLSIAVQGDSLETWHKELLDGPGGRVLPIDLSWRR